MTPVERRMAATRAVQDALTALHRAEDDLREARAYKAETQRLVVVTRIPCPTCGAGELVWCHGDGWINAESCEARRAAAS